MPAVLTEFEALDVQAWQWMGLAASLGVALLVALGLGALARRLALRLARRTRATWDDLLVDMSSGPARLLLGLFTFTAVSRLLRLAEPAQQAIDQTLRIATVALFAWAGIRAIGFGAEVLTTGVSARGGDTAARSRLTQIMVMKRIAAFIVIVVGGALVLVQFEALRALGTSLLASAGVAGIVIGLAAQRSIATLLALAGTGISGAPCASTFSRASSGSTTGSTCLGRASSPQGRPRSRAESMTDSTPPPESLATVP